MCYAVSRLSMSRPYVCNVSPLAHIPRQFVANKQSPKQNDFPKELSYRMYKKLHCPKLKEISKYIDPERAVSLSKKEIREEHKNYCRFWFEAYTSGAHPGRMI